MSTYTVKAGDTLQSIAFKVFGDESMAQYLASVNGVAGYPGIAGGFFYAIHTGQVLQVGTAGIETTRLWPWGVGACVLAGVLFRKQIVNFFKK